MCTCHTKDNGGRKCSIHTIEIYKWMNVSFNSLSWFIFHSLLVALTSTKSHWSQKSNNTACKKLLSLNSHFWTSIDTKCTLTVLPPQNELRNYNNSKPANLVKIGIALSPYKQKLSGLTVECIHFRFRSGLLLQTEQQLVLFLAHYHCTPGRTLSTF